MKKKLVTFLLSFTIVASYLFSGCAAIEKLFGKNGNGSSILGNHEHSYSAFVKDENADTHTKTCDCGEKITEPCSGGVAICGEKAVCSVCNTVYGSVDESMHVISNGKCTLCGKAGYTRMNADGTLTETGGYLTFGSYPQSKVTDETLIATLTEMAGTLPADGEPRDWTSYDYYILDSNETDYMWYIDKEYNGEKYRGVYFTTYRPAHVDIDSSYNDSYQDENGYNPRIVYWFKYEPIKWRILEEYQELNRALILSELAIDSQEYHPTLEKNGEIHASNYVESSIRKWLNDNFYNTAFSAFEKKLIEKTIVDNYDYNSAWACKNTVDNIFLLGCWDIVNKFYGFNEYYQTADIIRQKTASDYAKCQGINSAQEKVYWLLRYGVHSYASVLVYPNGKVDQSGTVNYSDAAVVPALYINL